MSATTDISLFLKESIDAQISTLISLTKSKKHAPESLVHELRKGIKRIRSLFRLFKPVINESSFYKTNELIAETGRLLTLQRESYVNLITFTEIEEQLGDFLNPDTRELIKDILEKQYKQAYSNDSNYFNNLIFKIAFQLSKIRDSIHSISSRSFPYNLLELAIERDYYKTIHYYNFSKISLYMEAIHKWRRFCKHFHTHLKFSPLNQSFDNKQLITDIENLAEILGKEHDFAVLDLMFSKFCYRNIDLNDRNRLMIYIDKERNRLRKIAFTTGREIFSKELVLQPSDIVTV